MRHIVFREGMSTFPVSILIKPSNLHKRDITTYYIKPLVEQGMKEEEFIAWELKYDDKGKAPVKLIVSYLETLLKAVKQVGSKYLLVADGAYFKKLTNERKTETAYGYVKPCTIKGYEDLQIILVPNFAGLFYNPAIQSKIDLGLNALATAYKQKPITIGKNALRDVTYIKHDDPMYFKRVQDALDYLKQFKKLTIDIEGFSLEFYKAGIGTISFSWDKHSAITIQVDYDLFPFTSNDVPFYGEQWDNQKVKALLKRFFMDYKGTSIYHNIGYDGKVLVYELFMGKDFFNYPGMMRGIETICRDFEDTKLITYLATNSCAGNTLGLKQNTHEFTGHYAQDDEDIKDIRRIDLDPLMEYNAIDTCATFYLYEKYWDKMIDDLQQETYESIFKPSVKVIMQMELTGVPISMERVLEVEKELTGVRDGLHTKLKANPIIKKLWYVLRQKESDKAHAKWKKKTASIEDFNYVEFNPGSDQQLQILLHEVMGYDVIDKTKSGAPSSGGDTLKKHLARATDPDEIVVLESLIGLGEVSILINTFINAFKNSSILKDDGWHYLHGNFNLGGTVSGRLSSSKP